MVAVFVASEEWSSVHVAFGVLAMVICFWVVAAAAAVTASIVTVRFSSRGTDVPQPRMPTKLRHIETTRTLLCDALIPSLDRGSPPSAFRNRLVCLGRRRNPVASDSGLGWVGPPPSVTKIQIRAAMGLVE
jgi:hypothetical protein